MIKNIVFDVGNVLVHYAPAKFIKRFTDVPEYQELLLHEIFLSVEWIKYDRGTISKEELGRTICSRVKESLHDTVLEIIDCWHEEIKPNEAMKPLVKQLKDQGYKLYILSNAPHAFHEFKHRIPALDLFDSAFVSAEWKLLKPQIEIFQAFCSHFQLVPSECLFIDDLAINVEGAINAGMDGCIFKGNIQELVLKLENAGVKLDKKQLILNISDD
ncbi:HAD family phosphatase [Enterococcus sp. BWB1-3]|uniref:HAD family hydrolase n=1 Tax=Enterococcus sp. BWB1-3 TaxID=2787713 RepID=UPI001924DB19|nr:HAD family phosphatase [Enterococcus sp. BWB1-3]MBL1229167.1 HAD family phosphatase [Enterococcus sp. BWB1-3]